MRQTGRIILFRINWSSEPYNYCTCNVVFIVPCLHSTLLLNFRFERWFIKKTWPVLLHSKKCTNHAYIVMKVQSLIVYQFYFYFLFLSQQCCLKKLSFCIFLLLFYDEFFILFLIFTTDFVSINLSSIIQDIVQEKSPLVLGFTLQNNTYLKSLYQQCSTFSTPSFPVIYITY